jgi:hypothetical protein
MSTWKFIGIAIVSAAMGLGIGFALRLRYSNTHAGLDGGLHVAGVAQAKTRLSHELENVDFSVAAQLERDLVLSKGVTRWLCWMNAIEKASLADMPRLTRLAGDKPALLRLLAARWMDLDPRNFFNTLAKAGNEMAIDPLARILLSEWSKRDPAAVLKALAEAPAFGKRDAWRTIIARGILKQDTELGLKLMSEWHITNYGLDDDNVMQWTARDPRHAAEFTLASPAGYVSKTTIETVGKAWAKTDPEAALNYATGQHGTLASTLASSALSAWAGRDLPAAARWLGSATPDIRNHLSAPVVEAWAKVDPAAALAWSEANLAGSDLSQAAGAALKSLAEKNVAEAARLVDVMEPSSARTAGAVAVAQQFLPSNEKPGRSVTPDALQWLRGLDANSTRQALQSTAWRWAESDPETLAAYLRTSHTEGISPDVYSTVAESLVRKDPTGGMDWVNAMPEAVRLQAGNRGFAAWRSGQPDAAMNWLASLPNDDPRVNSYLKYTLISLMFDNQAGAQLAAMPLRIRTAARSMIENLGLPPERRAQLLSALKGP